LPNVYPGYQKVVEEKNQRKFEAAWGVPLSPRLGKTATELVPGILEGTTSALYVMAENPIMSEPDTNHVRKSFEQLDFMVLQEIFLTETALYADVLLPGVSFAEKTGTFTNTERRVQMIAPVISPLGDSKPDWQITAEIARRMMAKRDANQDAPFVGWDYQSPAEILDEAAALTPIYGGINHARILAGERIQWPCTGTEHPGTPILHVGKFARGLGKFHAVDYIPPAEQPDEDYPFVMSTGRVLYHWHGGEMTRRTNGLNKIYGEAMVEINPEDAEKLGATDESYLDITSRRGTIKARAWVTERVPPGMVYTNFHFPVSSANILTQAVLDPIAKIPEYKVTAVRVERVK
ncbi:MAG TPA: formate dehydrogenase subunit alpha, partial [Anaerolineales bacterium]|nr:formate dehydrogenase subunit alpha [Anaerolineales bacterium]